MEKFRVTGMTCAACQARVEKAVSKVEGVKEVSVNLLTNSMQVEGDAPASEIVKAVEEAGYGASLRAAGEEQKKSSTAALADAAEELEDRNTPQMLRRLTASVAVLLILMYFSMGVHMWNFPVPPFMKGNHVAMGLMQMLLSLVLMLINRRFFVSGYKSLVHGAPNMDTLIAIGAGASFAYSLVMLFRMTELQVRGGSAAAMPVMNEFYFESAGMILTLITVGKTLESYAKGRTTDALKSLMRLAPQTATVIRGGREMSIGIGELQVGDLFVVRPGEQIPTDGEVLEGRSAVDESALTGESIPADKGPGAKVSAATYNQSGFLKCRATRVGEDTSLSQIIAMVSDAAASKAPVARMADRICGVFVPAVMIAAAAVMCFWMIFTLVQTGSADAGLALQRGISVLVVSCPCALGLATPVAIMVGSGKGARNGILFKNAQALQETGNIRIVALDKTGTITNGRPEVTEIYAADSIPGGGKSGHSKDSIPGGGKNSHSKDSIPEQSGLSADRALLQLAASLESKSGHPLAQAVCRKAEAEGLAPSESTDFAEIPGQGLSAVIGGKVCFGGNLKFIREHAPDADDWAGRAETLAQEGKTPLFFAEEGRMLGLLAVADTMKPDSAEAIRQLRGMGLRVVMLTGDNRRTAEAVGRLAGVDEVVADVLPAAKEAAIRTLQKKGKTAMVGDGINDAPALTRADVGIAIGAGTDVAIDAADVVLAKSGLSDVAAAIRLSRATYRNILENLFWALIYNVLLIPLAAGAYLHWGLSMNPMWGAAAMSMSSVFVVSNALRLNLLRLYDRAPGLEEKTPGREEKAPGREEKAPGREEKAPDRDENTSGRGERNRCEKEKNMKMENTEMTKTVRIEGMMCEHCEARVKKTLEALAGVEKAEVSHKSGTAVLTLAQEVSDDVIREAVEAQDYKFVSAK